MRMSRRLSKKKALRGLELAFKAVTLDDGLSLHETLEIDDYRRILPGSKSREYDEVYDWRKLVGSAEIQKFRWNGGITFLDAKGFRFYIPAYLTMGIRTHQLGDIASIMIFNLTRPGDKRLKGFQLFNSSQRKAIFNAVLYLHEFDIAPLDAEELAGLYEYWT